MIDSEQHEGGMRTVGRTAELVGVSVRTLHHWDQIGLVVPSERSWSSVTYDCTPSMHVLLARMYTEDPRFTQTYEEVAPGLAPWLREIIEASARTHGVDPETACWE